MLVLSLGNSRFLLQALIGSKLKLNQSIRLLSHTKVMSNYFRYLDEKRSSFAYIISTVERISLSRKRTENSTHNLFVFGLFFLFV